MKYQKLFNHSTRNIFLYVLLYFFFSFNFDFEANLTRALWGIVFFLCAYIPVYLLNDFADSEDDQVFKKANVYSLSRNKVLYWIMVVVLVAIGTLGISIVFGFTALLLLLSLYSLNFFYSFKPFRLRDKNFLRESNLFFIYFVRWILYSFLLGFPLEKNFPFAIFLFGSSFAALMLVFYKQYRTKDHFAEYFFGTIFVATCVICTVLYPWFSPFFLPLIPLGIFFRLKYKGAQVPVGRYQIGYFLYGIAVYIVVRSFLK